MHLKRNHRRTFWGKPRLQKCRQCRALANLAKSPKSAIFWDYPKGGPRENCPKSRSTSGTRKSPRRESRNLLISMLLRRNHRRTFWRKPRLLKCRQCRALANLAKWQKSAIFWDYPKGGPRENCPKSRSISGARKSPRRESRDLLISMHLKRNHRSTFWRKPRLQKCRQCRVLANLAKSPKSAIFWDYPKGGPRENCLKSRATSGTGKSPRRESCDLIISMHLKRNHRRTFWRKPRLQKCRQCRAFTNLAKSPKSAVFWDYPKRGPRENCPKSRSTSGARKSPRRESRDLLISMHLKRNHRKTFWRKPRLQKCRQCRALANLAKSPKSAIFWDFPKGGPRENCPKSRSTSGARKSPERESRDLLISMHLKRNHRRTFWRKPRLQKCRQCRALANLAKSPKSAIFWDFPKGGPRENCPKSRSTSGTRKSPWRESHGLLISMHLKRNHRRTFWRKLRLQKCRQCRALANLAKSPKWAIFWDYPKGGPRENCPKSRSISGTRKSPRRESRDVLISMHLKRNYRRTFWRKPRLQKCRQCRALANLAKLPKSAIFWDFPKGGPRENCPKSRSTSGTRKSPRRESRDLLISMNLKRNHRRTFWRKLRLQKCRQCRALANLAKSPKSAIFWDFPNGGPRENCPKSRSTSGAQKSP